MKNFVIGLVCVVLLIVAMVGHQFMVENLFDKDNFTMRVIALSVGLALLTSSAMFVVAAINHLYKYKEKITVSSLWSEIKISEAEVQVGAFALGGLMVVFSFALSFEYADRVVQDKYGKEYGVYMLPRGNKVYKVRNQEDSKTIQMTGNVSVVTPGETSFEYVGKMNCEESIDKCNQILVENKDKILAQLLNSQTVVSK